MTDGVGPRRRLRNSTKSLKFRSGCGRVTDNRGTLCYTTGSATSESWETQRCGAAVARDPAKTGDRRQLAVPSTPRLP